MGRSVKAQFKYADKIGARYAAAIGANEAESGVVNIKEMSTGESSAVKINEIYEYLIKR